MKKGWHGNRMGHSLASRGISTTTQPPITFGTRKRQILYYLEKLSESYKKEYDELFENDEVDYNPFQIYDDYPNIMECIIVIRNKAKNMEDVKRIMLEYKVHYMDDEEGIDMWLNQILVGEKYE